MCGGCHRGEKGCHAVAQHGDIVTYLKNLIQPVRDIYNGHTARLQAANGAEQVLHFTFRQRAGGLVHNKHLGVCSQCLHNFYYLLVLHRKGLHLFLHGKGTANGIYQFLRAAVHRVPIYKAVRLHAFIAQKDVFCHCKVWEQVELLMDDGNARGARLHGILKVNRLAFIQNATAVVVVYAGENAH